MQIQHIAILALLSAGCAAWRTGPVTEPSAPDPQAHFEAGISALNDAPAPDYAAARGAFVAAASASGSASAWYNAGWAAERMGQTEAASADYRRALTADPGHRASLRALAAGARFEDAEALYTAWLDAHPDDLEIRNDQVASRIRAERYPEALEAAQAILLRAPEDVAVYRNLSRLYFAQSDWKMSLLCAEKAKLLRPGDAGVYNDVGVIWLELENEPAAVESFKDAIRLDPDSAEANLNLGLMALGAGDYALAARTLEIAAAARPGDLDALLALAAARGGQGEFDGAIALYDRALAVSPDHPLALERRDALVTRRDQPLPTLVSHPTPAPDPALMAALEHRLTDFDRDIADARCPEADVGVLAELEMIAEQGRMVVDSEMGDMAGDMLSFLEDYQPALESLVALCAAGEIPGDAPGPAETSPEIP